MFFEIWKKRKIRIFEHWYAATAHAPNHVTREQGVKNNYILEFPTPICLFTIRLLLATTTIKSRLLSSVTLPKALDCVNFLCVTLWPWPSTFWSLTVTTHGVSRDQPCHQVWSPTAIRSWVTSYNVSHWLPLKMRMAAILFYANY